MEFTKRGIKRRRFTRRELPLGQSRRWGATVGNFRRERERLMANPTDPPIRAYQYR